MTPHRFLPLLLLLFVGVGMAKPASAQLLNPYRNSSQNPLTADDFAALTGATERLLDRPNLVAGGTEPWSNPKSGASGTVMAGNPVRRHGLACRMMVFDSTIPGPSAKRRTTLAICKTPEGLKIG